MNELSVNYQKGERFTINDFINKSKLSDYISETNTIQEQKNLRRIAESIINFYCVCGLIEKVDTKVSVNKKDRRGRPRYVYQAKKNLSFFVGELTDMLENSD